MTRAQLEAVIDALTAVAESWNQAAADEERGPSSDALCLTLFDDGSGSLGRRNYWESPDECLKGSDVEDWHEFHNFEELVKVLRDGEGVEFEGAAPEQP